MKRFSKIGAVVVGVAVLGGTVNLAWAKGPSGNSGGNNFHSFNSGMSSSNFHMPSSSGNSQNLASKPQSFSSNTWHPGSSGQPSNLHPTNTWNNFGKNTWGGSPVSNSLKSNFNPSFSNSKPNNFSFAKSFNKSYNYKCYTPYCGKYPGCHWWDWYCWTPRYSGFWLFCYPSCCYYPLYGCDTAEYCDYLSCVSDDAGPVAVSPAVTKGEVATESSVPAPNDVTQQEAVSGSEGLAIN